MRQQAVRTIYNLEISQILSNEVTARVGWHFGDLRDFSKYEH
jgi:hypothetical protein